MKIDFDNYSKIIPGSIPALYQSGSDIICYKLLNGEKVNNNPEFFIERLSMITGIQKSELFNERTTLVSKSGKIFDNWCAQEHKEIIPAWITKTIDNKIKGLFIDSDYIWSPNQSNNKRNELFQQFLDIFY
ncbi:MAG: hypothetical protein WC307_03435 [Candidatus Nanoarchaeia archaeon]|jgi:hypothetical protein